MFFARTMDNTGSSISVLHFHWYQKFHPQFVSIEALNHLVFFETRWQSFFAWLPVIAPD